MVPGDPDVLISAPSVATEYGAGLYCASCHTPHGNFGQLVNNWTPTADEGRQISWQNPVTNAWETKFLHFDPTAVLTTGNSGAWLVCDADLVSNCEWAQVRDAKNRLVSLYGYKLLSSSPNHTNSTEQSYMTEEFNDDGARWCASCHTSKSDMAYHNHSGGCSACHGNPSDGSSSDFPHTSQYGAFLIDLPDALCITCHLNVP